ALDLVGDELLERRRRHRIDLLLAAAAGQMQAIHLPQHSRIWRHLLGKRRDRHSLASDSFRRPGNPRRIETSEIQTALQVAPDLPEATPGQEADAFRMVLGRLCPHEERLPRLQFLQQPPEEPAADSSPPVSGGDLQAQAILAGMEMPWKMGDLSPT